MNDELLNVLENLIKIGEVSSIDPAKATARVVFDDEDSLVSFDLQVLQKNTFGNKDYSMPEIGEDVVCLFLPSGPEDGFILGAVYAGEIEPPENSEDVRTILFKDGTKIKYDRAAHELTAEIGDVKVRANQNGEAEIEAPEISIKGDLKVSGKIKADGDIESAGNMKADGDVKASGDLVAGTIGFSAHVHDVPQAPTGTSVSGTPYVVVPSV